MTQTYTAKAKKAEYATELELVNKLKKAEKSKHYNFDEIKEDLFS
ncbi:hypothetical protein [uncultured Lactobacillus sp.]|nr:hypothetical protein [uncultured Lactobacillus sp.]